MKGSIQTASFVALGTLFMVLGHGGLRTTRPANAADYTFQVSGGPSMAADISADGRYVVFESFADDLVENDTNGVQDIFLHDRDADGDGVFDEHDKPGGVSTIRISIDSNGNPALGGDSANPAISADGRYVAFQSLANNLVDNDTNGVQDIFLHDRDADNNGVFDEHDKPGGISTIRVSVASNGNPAAGGDSANPAISDTGRYVVFQSYATNLLGPGNDTNGVQDIFRHDTSTGDTVLVNVDSNGNPAAGGDSANPAISDTGRYVVFQSYATNLLGPGNDTNGVQDIFRRDISTGDTVLVNVDSNGNPAAGGDSANPAISDTGRYVVFQSYATNLLGPGNDTNGVQDIFRHDISTGDTVLVNVDSNGNPAAGGDSANPYVSGNGRYVVFQSLANNLVSGDTNGLVDVFVHDANTDETVRLSIRTVEFSDNGTRTGASSGSGGGSGCFISAAGHGSPGSMSMVSLLLSVLLGATTLSAWKRLKKPTKPRSIRR